MKTQLKGVTVNPQSVRLKYLLLSRHWQTYRTFRAEYDRAAEKIDPQLVGTWPSRAQFHRWLSGDLKGFPYPDHCRTLETMFPDWTTEQLFELISEDQASSFTRNASTAAGEGSVHSATHVDNISIFMDLTEEDNRTIAQRIRNAQAIFFTAHTGYNALVSQYQPAIRAAVANGCAIRVVVTDPDGPLMRERELTTRLCPSIRQEGEIRDVLHTCGNHRAHAVAAGHSADNVRARTYAGVPTVNAFLVDGWLRIISYLPLLDMAECPVFEYMFDVNQPTPLVDKYLQSIERLWKDATPVEFS